MIINFSDNPNLDGMGFSPFAKVVEGMEAVDALYSGYGELAPIGMGPEQYRIQTEGNKVQCSHMSVSVTKQTHRAVMVILIAFSLRIHTFGSI